MELWPISATLFTCKNTRDGFTMNVRVIKCDSQIAHLATARQRDQRHWNCAIEFDVCGAHTLARASMHSGDDDDDEDDSKNPSNCTLHRNGVHISHGYLVVGRLRERTFEKGVRSSRSPTDLRHDFIDDVLLVAQITFSFFFDLACFLLLSSRSFSTPLRVATSAKYYFIRSSSSFE